MSLNIVKHALLDHYLTVLRDRDTGSDQFRNAALHVGRILAIESTRDLKTQSRSISTPLEPFEGRCISDVVVAVPILRAGLAMVDAVSEIIPDVVIGYIGLQRDEKTAMPSAYYNKLPKCTEGATVLLLDPMLATGGSANMALRLVKAANPSRIRLLTIVSAPEGVAAVEAEHPDVVIYTSALDRQLNSSKFILPGLGDFGDRVCNT